MAESKKINLTEEDQEHTREEENVPAEIPVTPKEKRVRVKVPKDSKDKSPVFVAVNGEGYTIQRGKWVEVPPHIAEAVKNAIEQRELVEVKIEELSESSE